MPPNRSKKSKKLVEQEGRIVLAIAAYKNGQIPSVSQAAASFNVPRRTLDYRIKGRVAGTERSQKQHKLTSNEEESLVKWILDLDKRGRPPRHAYVQSMANHILATRGTVDPLPRIGQNWVYRLVKRHPELKSRFSRRYDYSRAKNEDPKIIGKWFSTVSTALKEYGFLPEDIYNFDETGFAMGLIATTRVITSSDYYGRAKLLQPGNKAWVTAIEAITATGDCLPPYIIFKGVRLQEAWFESLPPGWRLDTSANGWTTDEITFKWLKNQFIPESTKRLRGVYRLLVLDGHGSHLTPEFDQLCAENKIIPLCMPPHSSHLLQPLDVGVFSPLKRAYSKLVEQRMRNNYNHVDKLDFLGALPTARQEAFTPQNIRSGFAATGLMPFEPNRVIQKLRIQLKTPTPPGSRGGSDLSSPIFGTPQNPRQLERFTTTVGDLAYSGHISPSTFRFAYQQLAKSCGSIMAQGAIMKKEFDGLLAANEKEKRKQRKSKKQLLHNGGITSEEAQELIPRQDTTTEASQPRKRAPPTCSDCRTIGHHRRQCPNRNPQ
jgi:hypothetical protein